jgi:hypothetical protein
VACGANVAARQGTGGYEPGGTVTYLATWGRIVDYLPASSRRVVRGKSITVLVFEALARRSAVPVTLDRAPRFTSPARPGGHHDAHRDPGLEPRPEAFRLYPRRTRPRGRWAVISATQAATVAL